MRFAHPDAIFLFFLLLPLIGLFFWRQQRNRRAKEVLGDEELRHKIFSGHASWPWLLKSILFFLAFIFLILALMEPQWGFREEEVKVRGSDLMILVDVSESMLAQDVPPSRLERQRRKLKDLLDMLAGDRTGLIAFAGRSFLLSPMTVDYGTLGVFVDDLSTDTIPIQGTDLAGALGLAMKAMSDPETSKNILILTDGEDHSEKMQKILEEIKNKKIKVFVLGIGTLDGAPIPEKQGGFKQDRNGQMIVSKLEEDFLKDLALQTGGAYVRTVTSNDDLKRLYLQGIRGAGSEQDLLTSKQRIWESRYYWPLGIALFFLFLERLIPEARKLKKV